MCHLIAVIGHTAAEVIVEGTDGNKDFMGLTSFEGKIPSFYETTIAKNDLTKKELDILNRKDILQDFGKISHEYAMNHVEKEYNIFKEESKVCQEM